MTMPSWGKRSNAINSTYWVHIITSYESNVRTVVTAADRTVAKATAVLSVTHRPR